MRRRDFAIALAIAAPFTSGAGAQGKPARVAFLALSPDGSEAKLRAALRDLGYRDGENLAFTGRSADGDAARLQSLAEELVRSDPDVIVTGTGALTPRRVKDTTAIIPIVFSAVSDPIGSGLVRSLANPGGNFTGLSRQSAELKGKQLQLLREVAPNHRVVGVLLNPDSPNTMLSMKVLGPAAEASGTRLELLPVRTPEAVTAAALEALMTAGAGSLLLIEGPLTNSLGAEVARLALPLRLPTMGGSRRLAEEGMLMSYGADNSDRARLVAGYVDKILKGANPADLPVQQPTKFEFVINLQTAKALDLTVPVSLLAEADEIIE